MKGKIFRMKEIRVKTAKRPVVEPLGKVVPFCNFPAIFKL